MDIHLSVIKLAEYTRSLSDFTFQDEIDRYDHIGALIVDAVLQAGIQYDSVVKPRALRILNEFPSAASTTGFLQILSQVGVEPLLDFHGKKAMRVMEVVCLLRYEGVETSQQLAVWLEDTVNRDKLKRIKGIKDKTVDYMRNLSGGDTNAIDRHLNGFLEEANIRNVGYEHAQEIVSGAAQLLGVSVSHYDHSIWRYMSSRRKSTVKSVHNPALDPKDLCRMNRHMRSEPYSFPERTERLPFQFWVNREQMDRLRVGFYPNSMDDKWFVFFEDNNLYFHRSWTGYGVYKVTLRKMDEIYLATDVWVSRDNDQYQGCDKQQEIKLLRSLLQDLLDVDIA